MVSEEPQIAKSRDRIRLDFRNSIRVRKPGAAVLGLEQPLQFDVIEANEIEGIVLLVQNRQFDTKHFFVPTCALDGQLVIGDDERTALRRRKVPEDDYWHFFHA